MRRWTIQELREGYQRKDFSPVEVLETYMDYIEKFNPVWNAFITVTYDLALKQAELAEKRMTAGMTTSSLEGIPMSIKDIIYTKGITTTNGSVIDKDFVPDYDAPIVSALSGLGALNLGKNNLHEYAFGITSNNPHYGPVRNPWNPAFTPGGSSGGSAAAVAGNLCTFSIGTDTGGSIRIPASSCGVIGLKPTYGYLPATGVTNISWTLDHVGPLTSNVTDLVLVMEALTGNSYSEVYRKPFKGLRVGVPRSYFTERINPEVAGSFRKTVTALEHMGAVVVEVDLPNMQDVLATCFHISLSEAGFVHKERIDHQMTKYGPDLQEILGSCKTITAVTYIEALKRRDLLRESFNTVFKEIDIMVTPTTPTVPEVIGRNEVNIDGEVEDIFSCMIRYTSVFNLTGHPALSMPTGLSSSALPIGLQLVTAHFREDILLRVAYAFEQQCLTEFYQLRDSICLSEINT